MIAASDWYVKVEGQQLGPYTEAELDAMVQKGEIPAKSPRWRKRETEEADALLKTLGQFEHRLEQLATGFMVSIGACLGVVVFLVLFFIVILIYRASQDKPSVTSFEGAWHNVR